MIENKEYKNTSLGYFPLDWQESKLGELFEIKAGGDLKKISFSKKKDKDFKYPIFSNSLSKNGLHGFSREYQYEPLCVTVTARGNVGHANCRFEKFNAIVRLLVLKPKTKISCYFVSNFINNTLQFSYVGAAQNQLTAPMISDKKIIFPSYKEQLKIDAILIAYDKLIEYNSRRIEVLEEMAQRIYKEWFINQEFEERSILEIPYFTFLKQNIKKFDGFKRYYATADVEGTNFLKEGIDYDYKNKPSRAQKKPIINSVWFARMKDSYKIAAFTKSNAFQAENSMLSSGFAGFSSKDIHFGFLYSTISSKVFDNLKNLYATGATQISLNNEGLSKIYVPYPNEEKVLEFCNIVNPIIDKSILLKNINKNLIETRDYLLPKLISGKVDVSNLDIDTSILDE